jgi:hypothetical protein
LTVKFRVVSAKEHSPGVARKAYRNPPGGTKTILTWPSVLRELSSAIAANRKSPWKKNAHVAIDE